MEFKDILTNLRKEQNMNQGELAKALGVSRSTISMYEQGVRMPTIEGMEAIADYFNVDMDYLNGRTNIKNRVIHAVQEATTLDDTYFSFAKEMQSKNVSVEDMRKLWEFYEMIKK